MEFILSKKLHIYTYGKEVNGSLLARCILSASGTHQELFREAAGRTFIVGSSFPKMNGEQTQDP